MKETSGSFLLTSIESSRLKGSNPSFRLLILKVEMVDKAGGKRLMLLFFMVEYLLVPGVENHKTFLGIRRPMKAMDH